ncbi:MAG: hypothetical protein ACLPTB_18740, partial [Acidimicrobiales bacterium]
RHAWGAFARTGDPDGGGAGATEGSGSTSEVVASLGHWPPYGADRRETMILGRLPGTVSAPWEAERSFWEARLGQYGVGGPVEGVDPGRATIETAEGRLAEGADVGDVAQRQRQGA